MQFGILTFEDPQPDTSRKILHIDMDAFYASVEIRDQPHLANKPVVIARHPRKTGGRGIVSTCNYVARQYGIHSAMSAQEAFNRCPHAVFIPTRHDYYRQVSRQIHQIFHRYTDIIEPLSLDEAYLDVTNNKLGIPSATIVGKMIQADIKRELNLTCSVGVSYNKFIAKIASDYQKPFGFTVVEPDEAVEFLKSLPIEDFRGIGAKSLPIFHEQNIYTGEDLYQCDLEWLIKKFGKLGFSLYFKVRGIHNAPVIADRERKSIGRETTFSQFLVQESAVLAQFRQLINQVVSRLNRYNLQARTVTIKIRYEDFETLTRQVATDEPVNSAEEIYRYVTDLWYEHGHLDKSIRLLGVTVSNFENNQYTMVPLNLSPGR